jgi:signal peptidase I
VTWRQVYERSGEGPDEKCRERSRSRVRVDLRSEPHAGDIIAFKYPLDPTVAYVKRIVAAGGSTVEIANGVVLVDGQPVPQGYVPKAAAVSDYSRNMRRIRVTPTSYFVMGDNRDNSEDSRSWGFVPRDHIIGKVGSILVRGR